MLERLKYYQGGVMIRFCCVVNMKALKIAQKRIGGANLRGADLSNVNLRGANLGGTKKYLNSHLFFQEIIRQQCIKYFTATEWDIIGQIIIHKLCWESIKKRYNKKVIPIFKKLSKVGFSEWEKYYKQFKEN